MMALALVLWSALLGVVAGLMAWAARASVVSAFFLGWLVFVVSFLLGVVLVWGVRELWYRQTGQVVPFTPPMTRGLVDCEECGRPCDPPDTVCGSCRAIYAQYEAFRENPVERRR